MSDCSTIPVAPGRRILLAEDNPSDVLLLQESFSAANLAVEIEWVTDGNQLLNRLRELHLVRDVSYGLVLLDMHLPQRSGDEVLAILRQDQQWLNVPIVVLTSVVSDQEKRRLLELGVFAVLSKPMDLEEYLDLASRLHAILEGR